jgi:hypothetical protein
MVTGAKDIGLIRDTGLEEVKRFKETSVEIGEETDREDPRPQGGNLREMAGEQKSEAAPWR